jgi:hypothetical protein
MIKFAALIIITAMKVLGGPAPAETSLRPFSFPEPEIINFNGNLTGQRVLLEWTVKGNESADIFEVEKGEDGKTFRTVALVFGSGKPTDTYQFYENVGKQIRYYRIKITGRDNKSRFTEPLTVKSAHK